MNQTINLYTLTIDNIDEICRENGHYVINLVVTTPFSQQIYKQMLRLDAISQYINKLTTTGFDLLQLDSKDIQHIHDLSNNKAKSETKSLKVLNTLFKEILKRKDLLLLPCTHRLLGIDGVQHEVDQNNKVPWRVCGVKVNPNSDFCNMECYYDGKTDLVLCLAYNRNNNNMGMMWNLIEPEVMSALFVYRITPDVDRSFKFVLVYQRQFHFRASCITYLSKIKLFAIGNTDGKIFHFSQFYRLDIFDINDEKPVPIMEHPMLHLSYSEAIKILDPSNLTIIGGGSLKSRLNGASLQTMCHKDKLLFLIDTNGRIMIYRRTTTNIEYVQSIELNISGKLLGGKMLICDSFLYVMIGYYILVFQFQDDKSGFNYKSITALKPAHPQSISGFWYDKKSKCFYVSMNHGYISRIQKETGDTTLYYKVLSDCPRMWGLKVDEQRDLMIVMDEQYIHMVHMSCTI